MTDSITIVVSMKVYFYIQIVYVCIKALLCSGSMSFLLALRILINIGYFTGTN
jgi:hypothetical protein